MQSRRNGRSSAAPAEAAELEDVDPGAEGAALAAHDHAVDVWSLVGVAGRVAQLEHHVVVDRVSLLGPVQDDVPDAVLVFDAHVFAHGLGSRLDFGATAVAIDSGGYMAIKKVGVVGCGLMGHGIAQVAAQAGYDVVVREVSQEKLDSGLGKIKKQLARAVEKGRMEQSQADEVIGRIKADARLRRLRRLRPRDRGDHGGPRGEARDVAGARPDRQAGGAVRDQHVVARRDRPGGGDEAPGALPRPPLLQPRPGDAAARGRAVDLDEHAARSRRASSSAES